MPITLSIGERKVKVDDRRTKPVLLAYKRALETACEPGSCATLSDQQLRSGFWNNHVSTIIESLGGGEALRTQHLAALHLKLDPPAELLLQGYLDFLNHALVKSGSSSEYAEAGEIVSVRALIRELLYRLAAIALSNDLDRLNDGKSMLRVLTTFTEEIKNLETLYNKPLFRDDNPSPFLVSLSSQKHKEWITLIQKMVQIVDVIHRNERIISNSLDNLKSEQRALRALLLGTLNGREAKLETNFTNDWLAYALREFETRCQKHTFTEDQLSLVPQINLNPSLVRERQVLRYFCLNKIPQGASLNRREELIKRVETLYRLLNYSETLLRLLYQLDLLITYTGWVPILLGTINFTKISALLNDFHEQCKTALVISDDDPLYRTAAGKGFIKQCRMEIVDETLDLAQLDSPLLRERIAGMVHGAVISLYTIQNEIDEKYWFVNPLDLPPATMPLSSRISQESPSFSSTATQAIAGSGNTSSHRLIENTALRQESTNSLVVVARKGSSSAPFFQGSPASTSRNQKYLSSSTTSQKSISATRLSTGNSCKEFEVQALTLTEITGTLLLQNKLQGYKDELNHLSGGLIVAMKLLFTDPRLCLLHISADLSQITFIDADDMSLPENINAVLGQVYPEASVTIDKQSVSRSADAKRTQLVTAIQSWDAISSILQETIDGVDDDKLQLLLVKLQQLDTQCELLHLFDICLDNQLALWYQRLGRLDKAIFYFTRAVKNFKISDCDETEYCTVLLNQAQAYELYGSLHAKECYSSLLEVSVDKAHLLTFSQKASSKIITYTTARSELFSGEYSSTHSYTGGHR